MHAEAYSWVKMVADGIDKKGRVLDMGSRDINGTCRPLFPDSEYIGIDLTDDLPGVDFVGDAAYWVGDGRQFDVVVCTEVLEHTGQGPGICVNAHALLKQGGVFVVTAAGVGRMPHSGIDGGPLREREFYRNVTRDDLKLWLDDFAFVLINENGHDIYALAVK